jgi:hypothetical protein
MSSVCQNFKLQLKATSDWMHHDFKHANCIAYEIIAIIIIKHL